MSCPTIEDCPLSELSKSIPGAENTETVLQLLTASGLVDWSGH